MQTIVHTHTDTEYQARHGRYEVSVEASGYNDWYIQVWTPDDGLYQYDGIWTPDDGSIATVGAAIAEALSVVGVQSRWRGDASECMHGTCPPERCGTCMRDHD